MSTYFDETTKRCLHCFAADSTTPLPIGEASALKVGILHALKVVAKVAEFFVQILGR